MIKIDEAPEPETPEATTVVVPVFELKVDAPSTESNLSFVADVNLDDIPFIDDDEDEERVGYGCLVSMSWIVFFFSSGLRF